MFDVLLRMTGLIALGVAWRVLRPGGLDGDTLRAAIATLVYYLLLPALVLKILWSTPLGLDSIRVAVTAAAVVIAGWALGLLAARGLHLTRARTGALLLAAAFPNATYMGLPALDAALGPIGAGIAIQFDYFACTPILLTFGVVMSQRYGAGGDGVPAWLRLARVPPFWAALIGVCLNALGVALPDAAGGLLDTLGSGVVPLMLLALGMSLSWQALDRGTALAIIPVLAIQLVLQPLLALALAGPIGLTGDYRIGAILEAAMPSMVLGIVLCDRYGLDSRYYSLIVTISTALSLATLPLWLYLLTMRS